MNYDIGSSLRKAFHTLLQCGIVLFALCFFLSGCVVLPGKDLPVRTYADLVQGSDKKTCVEIFAYTYGWSHEIIIGSVHLLEKSGHFLKAPERCTPDGDGEQNSIYLNFKDDPKPGDIALSSLSAAVTVSSLAIIPGFTRERFQLDVKLRKQGRLVKEYTYRESMETWVHISLFFRRSDHIRIRGVREVYERMLMNFLYDYSHEVQQHDFFGIDQKI